MRKTIYKILSHLCDEDYTVEVVHNDGSTILRLRVQLLESFVVRNLVLLDCFSNLIAQSNYLVFTFIFDAEEELLNAL